MPRGDKTGPMGMGPMTGRGAGICKGNDSPGYMNAGGDRLDGPGRMGGGLSGRHRGCRNMFYATGLPGWMRFVRDPAVIHQDEMKFLKSQADYLRKTLDAINKRLSEIISINDAAK